MSKQHLILALICLLSTVVIGYDTSSATSNPPTIDQADQTALQVEFEAAVAFAIAQHRAIPNMPFYFSKVGETTALDLGGGVVYAHIHDQATGEVIPGIVEMIYANKRDNTWEVRLPGDPNYVAARQELPQVVLNNIDFAPYKLKADPDIEANLTLNDYELPYQDGGWGTVTRSFNIHGTGQIDFDIGNQAVTAAKDGRIVYVLDHYTTTAWNSGGWWYWNVVVIEHNEHEYSLYGHLANDSVPGWIKEQCATDYSQPNCDVPISAGQPIAMEGNTGYSSNPHLHVEFGQAYNIVAYPDTSDVNGDGSRVTPLIYSAYVYQEHNIAFEGYAPDDIAEWPYGTLQQASHGQFPPANQNIINNGDFSAGTAGWQTSGQISWNIENGAVYFMRLATAEEPQWAAFRQDTGYGAPANFPFEASLDLGNPSGAPKTVTLTVYSAAGSQYGAFNCDFNLPPGAPLQRYMMRGKTDSTWALVRLQVNVNPPDGVYAAAADNITLQHRPDLPINGTECFGP